MEAESGSAPLFFLRALRKNWLLVVGVSLVALLAATFVTLGQKKIYRSRAIIQIDPNPPRPLGNDVQGVVEMGTGAYLNNREYYETQYKVIQSHHVAELVVKRLALHRDAAFLTNAAPDETPSPQEVSVEAAADAVIARMEVEPQKSSRLVTISFTDADPARAERVLSTIVDCYREQNLDGVLSSTNSAVEWLRDQLGKLKTELESSEMALHNYKKTNNILSLSMDDQSNMLREEMSKLNDTLTIRKADREKIASRVFELKKVKNDDPADLPSQELLANQLLQELRKDYIESGRTRAGLISSGKGENYPEVAAAGAREAKSKMALLAEVRNIRRAQERDLAAVNREIGGIQKLYNSSKDRALELNLLEIEYNRLNRSKSNTEKLYGLVLDRTKQSDLTLMVRVNNIGVVDKARVPQRPVRPNVPVNVALGLLGGIALGIGFAFGKEVLDRSIKTPEDIEQALGLNFLGLLPQVDATTSTPKGIHGRSRRHESDGAPELLVHRYPSSGMAEAARAVRTNLMFMSPDKPYRTLLVTSGAPMEGKTTVACYVAIAMAQAGQRVCLVDCDMRRPRVHKIFGRNSNAGVTTALLDVGTLDSMDLATEVPNLSVLPCGPIPPNPAELLHSEAFGKLQTALLARFDRVVFDSPPLLPVTDGAVLSTRVDCTVLVVRAFKTSKDVARKAARSVSDVGGRIVGTVLNAVDLKRREYSYQDYYYAKEGYGTLPVDDEVG